MFVMNFQQNISFGGYNPFMVGCFNPRLNLFLGLAAGTAGFSYQPLMQSCGYSIFNPYIPMNYSNPYPMGGLRSFNYQTPQTFTYIPQTTSNPFATVTPSTTFANKPLTTSSECAVSNNTKAENVTTGSNKMKIKSQGINLIKGFESCSLKACKAVSTEKKYSIGWGHYGVAQGTVWTQQQADEQLIKDLAVCEQYVNRTGRKWTQNQFDALVSFTYNCGPKNLEKLLKNRNNEQIADAMLAYNKSGGTVLRGLTKRRQAERNMFLSNTYEHSNISAMA